MRHKICLTILATLGILGACAMVSVSWHQTLAEEPKKSATKPVPFKLAKPDQALILLETVVNGKGPYRFVLDTGASLTMISPQLAENLDVKREEAQKATGAGGNVDIHFGIVQSLAVGETRLEAMRVGIMDLTGISKVIETDIDGIVGYNFLSKFRVLIDYRRRR
jgi:predicted aspartyl protease